MKRLVTVLLSVIALLAPRPARAQIDALIDAVVDAVEPTPVYDIGLREATENLALKIERLNHVLFGGSEETSAAYRYATMYSDLYDITTAFSGFVDRSYSSALRLEKLYERLDGESTLHDYAFAVEDTWHTYDNTVRQGGAIVARFKSLFEDPNSTNAEVRSAAREAVSELRKEQQAILEKNAREMAATELASGLVECSRIIEVSPEAYVTEGKKTYGTTLSGGVGSGGMGYLGTAVMVILGLLSIVYGAFAGVHIMRGNNGAESILGRLLFFLVFAIIFLTVIEVYL